MSQLVTDVTNNRLTAAAGFVISAVAAAEAMAIIVIARYLPWLAAKLGDEEGEEGRRRGDGGKEGLPV
ncbi:hypothetical protein BDW60DRAFT_176396, partial [Aspergillus nidulans var. acristatus]